MDTTTLSYKICRTCLKRIEDTDSFVDLNSRTDAEPTETGFIKNIRLQLTQFITDINLSITPKAVLCDDCSTALMVTYTFKKKCEETENRIVTYLRQHGLNTLGYINLNKVVYPNADTFSCIEINDSGEEESYKGDTSSIDVLPTNSTNFCIQNNIQRYFECNECGYIVERKAALALHLRYHRLVIGTRQKCSVCRYTCQTKHCLKRHMKRHLKKPYHCNKCDFQTKFISSLKTHLRAHTGEQPYDCKECDYATVYRRAFINHRKIHTPNEDDPKQLLNERRQSKDQVNPKKVPSALDSIVYKCKSCSNFKTKSYVSFKIHLKTHGDDRFKCCWCNFKTKFRHSLIFHVRLHTGEKPFKCTECNYCSVQSGNVKRHLKCIHGII